MESFEAFLDRSCPYGDGAIWTIYSFYVQAIPGVSLSTTVIELGWAFCTINCVMLTAGMFLMFTCIQTPEPPRFIADISKLTYGMYLIHIFWLGMWVNVFKNDMQLATVLAIPVISVATYITSYLSCKLISYLPGSKWMIGALYLCQSCHSERSEESVYIKLM